MRDAGSTGTLSLATLFPHAPNRVSPKNRNSQLHGILNVKAASLGAWQESSGDGDPGNISGLCRRRVLGVDSYG